MKLWIFPVLRGASSPGYTTVKRSREKGKSGCAVAAVVSTRVCKELVKDETKDGRRGFECATDCGVPMCVRMSQSAAVSLLSHTVGG